MAAKGLEWRPGPAVCRCCFAEGCYKDISTEYFWMGKREVYSEMLLDTFDVSVSINANLPFQLLSSIFSFNRLNGEGVMSLYAVERGRRIFILVVL